MNALNKTYEVVAANCGVGTATVAQILDNQSLFPNDVQGFLATVITLPPHELANYADRIADIMRGVNHTKVKVEATYHPLQTEPHIDDWIDGHFGKEPYARWFFFLARLGAAYRMDWAPWIARYKLFCTYNGKRYRVTGASRFGDIWLTANFDREQGYEYRVAYDQCCEWSASPELKVEMPLPKDAKATRMSVGLLEHYCSLLKDSGKDWRTMISSSAAPLIAEDFVLETTTYIDANGLSEHVVLLRPAQAADHVASVKGL